MNKPSSLTEIKRLAFSLCKPIKTLILLFPEGVPDIFCKDNSLTLLAKAPEDREYMLAINPRKRFLPGQEILKILAQKELKIEQLRKNIQESVQTFSLGSRLYW